MITLSFDFKKIKLKQLKILGLMSGSSCDGVDAALCGFSMKNDILEFELIKTASFKFSNQLSSDLRTAASSLSAELNSLNSEFSIFLGENISSCFPNSAKIDYIASHGHTVLHAPEKGFTVQLGNGALISAETGIATICDFRSQDIAHGGQGAPLAPLADKYLFGGHDFYLNLGGIVNVSHLNAEKVIGFDIAPCNQMLNALSKLKGLEFDPEGELASRGRLNVGLLDSLLNNEYLTAPYPKSLDNNWVYSNYTDPILSFDDSIENRLHTTVEFIAVAIKDDLQSIADKERSQLKDTSVFCTGGGAFNNFLMERIKFHCESIGVRVEIPQPEIIEYKEAMLMALMGYLRVIDKPNCIASVTGASKDCSAGVIYYP